MSAPASWSVARVFAPLSIAIAVLGLYLVWSHHEFLIDDHAAIVSHPDVVHAEGLGRLWTRDYWAGQAADDSNLYRPLTVLSYHVQSRLSGFYPIPFEFRLVNILLLGLAAWLAALWMGRYVHSTLAWFASLLIAAHPANVEVIHHVVGRADLLAVIGIVGFLWLQARSAERRRWTPGRLVGAVLFAALAVGSKETGLLVVPLALVQACLSIPLNADEKMLPEVRRVLAISGAVLLAVSAVYLAGRVAAVGWWPHYGPTPQDLTGNPLRNVPSAERVPAAVSLAWFYARTVLWPHVGFNQTPAVLPTWASLETWLGLAVIISVVAGFAKALRRRHFTAVALALALGQYLLVGNLLTPGGAYAANRLSLPFLVAGAALAAGLMDRWAGGEARGRAIAVVPVALLLILMGVVTFFANGRWQSELALFRADAANDPENPTALYQYGNVYAVRADQISSAPEIAGDPESGTEHTREYLEAAIRWLQEAVSARPGALQARRDLATAYYRSGDPLLAEFQWRDIVKLAPDDGPAWSQLLGLLLEQGKLDDADWALSRALALAPDHPDVMHNAAVLAVMRGRYTLAVERYEALLKKHPGHARGRVEFEELKRQLRGLGK